MPISDYDRQDKTPRAFMTRPADGGEYISYSGTPEIHMAKDCPDAVRRIVELDLPVWLDLFQMKSREYGDNADNLGPKGQFADMSRKFGKLRRALWDGHEEELTTETVEEILLDLIGHCFLTIDQRRRGIQ